jgi:acyl transferase domain-containing protein/D-arabinose 1-dehydrogenase-like Zn-dependent alcohol dehydrogenase/acyl carrier protein
VTDNDKIADYLRRATLDLRAARRRIRELESDPIAIVSTACRLPGQIHTPEQLWQLLDSGGETLSDFPDDRGWDLSRLFHPDPDHPGTSYVRRAGFLSGAGEFDAEFFGVSPREAVAMDPQQRLLLESCWELVESAGIDPHSLRGSATGVFLGVARQGYGVDSDVDGYSVTGVAPSVASGRLSYTLGFEGPAITLDTACSSSLVALHLAADSLRRRESDLAVVGGAAVMARPEVFVDFSRQRALAADGRSKAFGADADGFGFSEGVVLLMLERASDARRNGHEIHALIRGSATNSDGASNGLSAPSRAAQRKVIRDALTRSGLAPGEIDAVEAHGTGTTLGDPIEASALLDAYGRDRDRPLWLGSVKSNIGHTQAAAGVAGLLKMILALRHETLPRTLHAEQPTPHVDWSRGDIQLLTTAQPWPRGERPRRAGVSAFGISGTNAHVVVEEAAIESAAAAEPVRPEPRPDGPVPLIVSARSAAALRAQAERIAALAGDADLGDLGHTLATARARHEHRAAVLATTGADAVRGLRAVAAGAAEIGGVAETARTVCFLFPGQGSQWAGMAAGLLESSSTFGETIRSCDEAFASLPDAPEWTVASVLRQDPGAPGLDRVDVVQPALFAVMVGLAEVWRSYGVEPAAVAGHSQGEIAAAAVAGAISLPDAARLVLLRSRMLRALSGRGGMLAVNLAEDAAADRLRPWGDRLAIAAVNGPRSIVVSGDPEALRELAEDCAGADIRTRLIDVDYASHSPQIDGLREELLRVLDGLTPRPTTSVAFHSTVTSRVMDGTELDADYWFRNLREPVRFADAVRTMADHGYDAFLEISPHPVLIPGVTDTLDAAGHEDPLVVGSLQRGSDDLLTSIATAHVSGVDVRWHFPGAGMMALPPYPFQRKHFWETPSIPEPADGLTYRAVWTRVDEPAPGTVHGTWVIVTPGAATPDWAGELEAALVARGAEPVRCAPADLPAVLADVPEPRGVLSLLAADEAGYPGRPSVPSGAVGTVALLRALAGNRAALWCLTQGAVRTVDSGPTRPAQAAVHGLGRAAALELGERWGGVLDLPETVDDRALDTVLRVLAAPKAESELAIRPEGLLGRRLERAALTGGDWAPSGTVLVTGAATAIGGRLVRWLAEHGAEHLVLIGDEVAAPAGIGTTITDLAGLRAAISHAPYPVTALVHAETLTRFGRIEDLDPEDFAEVVEAKSALPAALDAALGEHRLEREIFCSSVAGTWGGAGLAGYAAGSAYLDALAEHRRAHGRPCTAVAWSPWSLPGAPVDQDYLRDRGLRALRPERALEVWSRVLGSDTTAVAVSDVDWPGFAEGFRGVRPTALFDRIPEAREPAAADTAGPADDGPERRLRDRLAGRAEPERVELLVELVSEAVARVLGHAPGTEINVRRAFSDLGFDSLASVRLRRDLMTATGLRLPASLVFDYPTITVLARHLDSRLTGEQARTEVTPRAAESLVEPIAVVGTACRFPGGIATPDELWQAVLGGEDRTGELPRDRGWDIARLYHPDPDHPGTSYADRGGFLADAAGFDPGFFGITPREALAMDPQQRLLLETTWEALERAGIDPATLRGSRTGVFIGSNGNSYMSLLDGEGDGYRGLGNSASVLSGRIAYTFGWEGPAITVDTACSASLVGIHLAMQALRRGECGLAVAAGVTVIADPYTFVDFSSQRGLAADGRCKAFSASADGFSLAEGVGALVLEPLSQARARGHRVLAVLRGSAVNSDGASNGLAAPNGPAQERVIRQALADAGSTPGEVDAVEAHGTGTELGDPIEAGALLATYGADRDHPLWIGSVKSNIGHTQAAAGIAGVLKMILALRHGMLPRTLHAAELSPHIDWDSGAVEVLRAEVPWPSGKRPRRAGVSSFGVSGTNAHVIVEEAPAEPPAAPAADRIVPLVLSGHTERSIAAQAEALAAWLRDNPDVSLVDTAHTLAFGRARLDVRAAVVGGERERVLSGLDALAKGEATAEVVPVREATEGRPVLVFPGQGAQWAGMARDLLDSSEVFAKRMADCAVALAPHTDWDLLAVLRGEPDEHDRVDVVQPLLFAIMVSLAELWRAHGVRPAAVIGHSQGEIAAACVAGALSLETAAKIVAVRSRVLRALDQGGGMASVAASQDDLVPVLDRWAGRLTVAAVNGPRSLVVAGETAALDEFLAYAERHDIRTRRIAVRYASHSPQVEAIEQRLLAELGPITAEPSAVPFYSTVTGDEFDTTGLDTGYWYRNLRQTVCFDQAVRRLIERGHHTFLEASPHPVLLPGIEDQDVVGIPSLRREVSGPEEFLRNLTAAHVSGVDVDLRPTVPEGRLVELPTYPFEHQRFWPRPRRGAGDPAAMGLRAAEHALLSTVVETPGDGGLVLTGRLSADERPWLAEHVIGGRTLLPGSAFVDLALTAAYQVGLSTVEELVLAAPLVLTGDPVSLRVSVGAEDNGRRTVAVHAGTGAGDWVRHATGLLGDQPQPTVDSSEWPPRGAEPIPLEGHYARLADRGYEYGPAFQALRAAWRLGEEIHAEVAIDDTVDEYAIHPVLLDAAAQTLSLSPLAEQPGARLPFSWNGVTLHATGASTLRVTATPAGPEAMSLRLSDPGGGLVATVDSLVLREVDWSAPESTDQELYRLTWAPLAPVEQTTRRCAAVGPGLGGFANQYRDLDSVADPAPDVVVVRCTGADSGNPAAAAREQVLRAAEMVRRWLGDDRFAESTLVFVTRDAVSVARGEPVRDIAAAALWSVIRSAQAESPGRFVLLDTDHDPGRLTGIPAVLDHPQVALRAGTALVPRLVSGAPEDQLVPPSGPYRLAAAGSTIDAVRFEPAPDADRPLAPGEVRIAVRAAGLNFRDVLLALGMYPDDARMGTEGAGTVLATGPGVTGVDVGDEVMGLFDGGLAPVTITDHRLVVPVPPGRRTVEAAAMPIAYTTAYYALHDLAGIRPGQSVLIHAATGGVGLAAVRLARLAGAEVFATASPGKHDTLRGLGFDDDHIASSRESGFGAKFRAATAGRGVDVVLNSLTGDLLDESAELLAPGGVFVELGKTELREPGTIPGRYRPFDLAEAGPDRLGRILAEVIDLAEPLPVTAWRLEHAPAALHQLSRAQHIGKLVLTVPPPVRPEGTVLITGGTGTLGRLLARHLVHEHGIRHLLLVSRQGPAAPGATELQSELDAEVRIVAADVTDREALAKALAGIPGEHPLTGVVHLAGVLGDGLVTSIDESLVDRVFGAKVDAAWHLHELTADVDLGFFALFSSGASVLAGPGQGGYAAANAVLDALAGYRYSRGLPGTALGWGLWAEASGMTGTLSERDRGRMASQGMAALPTERALALFDRAIRRGDPVVFPLALDKTAIAAAESPPEVLRGLVRAPLRKAEAAGAGPGLADRLAAMSPEDQEATLVALVCSNAAAVAGHHGTDAFPARRAFRDLGFDSLAAVELRNRLAKASGLRLPSTLIFDYPTPSAVAEFLRGALVASPERVVSDSLDRLEKAVAGLPDVSNPDFDRTHRDIAARMESLLRSWKDLRTEPESTADLSEVGDEELFELLDQRLGDGEAR